MVELTPAARQQLLHARSAEVDLRKRIAEARCQELLATSDRTCSRPATIAWKNHCEPVVLLCAWHLNSCRWHAVRAAWGNHGIGECRLCRQSYSAGDVWDHWTLRLNDITSDLITEQTGQAHPTALGRSRIFEEGRAAADGTPNPHTDCLSKAAITWLCGYLANDRSAFVAAQIAQAHAEGHSAQPGDNNPYYGRRALAVAWREGYRGALEEWAAEAIERQRRLRERARGEQRSE